MDCMMEACRKAGVALGVSYQRRMNPDNLAIEKLMDENRLWKDSAVDLSCEFWKNQEFYVSAPYRGDDIDGGGPFMQQAVHNLDYYQWLFGMPVEVTSMAGTSTVHNLEVEDHGAVLMRQFS